MRAAFEENFKIILDKEIETKDVETKLKDLLGENYISPQKKIEGEKTSNIKADKD